MSLSGIAVSTMLRHEATTALKNLSPTDNSRAKARAKRAVEAREASSRRRLVDPTTCEREYSTAELEFMNAIQAYKHSSGRMFPTWSEVLEVLKGLGYEKSA